MSKRLRFFLLIASWIVASSAVAEDKNGFAYVDLGLPSGTLWATCNVGATQPEECGDFYAWGETETKESYDWNNYIWSDPLNNRVMTKYNATDEKMVLERIDDVANVKWGEEWRMPTVDDFSELINPVHCEWVWNTKNGISGFEIKSLKNNDYIFLPAYNRNCNIGSSLGYYWSSSFEEGTDAYELEIRRNAREFDDGFRCNACNVRPVITGIVIQYNSNGGSGDMFRTAIPPGSSCTLSKSNYTRSGYKFIGWNTSADGSGTSYSDGALIQPSSSLTLYAQWQNHMVVISYDKNGGGGSQMDNQICSEDKVTLSKNKFSKLNCHFNGWNTNPDGSGKWFYDEQVLVLSDVFDSESVTLYAQWIADQKAKECVQYVDLGLPSGVLWATCNVGTSNIDVNGSYYAWGEITPNSFSGDNYNNYVNGVYVKYNQEDGRLQLGLEDDAAYMNWGGNWRMPTSKEFQELLDECDWEYITLNNQSGSLFKSRKNSNSLFLPTLGSYNGGSLNDPNVDYWTSSLDTTDSQSAIQLYLFSSSQSESQLYSTSRLDEQPIRPVMSRIPKNGTLQVVSETPTKYTLQAIADADFFQSSTPIYWWQQSTNNGESWEDVLGKRGDLPQIDVERSMTPIMYRVLILETQGEWYAINKGNLCDKYYATNSIVVDQLDPIIIEYSFTNSEGQDIIEPHLNCTEENLIVTLTGADTYLWSDGVTDNPRILVKKGKSTTYQVTGEKDGAISEPIEFTITEDFVVPDVTIASVNAVGEATNVVTCTDTELTLIASVSNEDILGDLSYTWSDNEALGANRVVSAENFEDGYLSKVYAVNVAASNGCQSEQSIEVTLDKNIPVLELLPVNICFPDYVYLSDAVVYATKPDQVFFYKDSSCQDLITEKEIYLESETFVYAQGVNANGCQSEIKEMHITSKPKFELNPNNIKVRFISKP